MVLAATRAEAQVVLTAFDHDALGPAGRTVVIEEGLRGSEISIFAVTDGERVRLLPPVRDYKRVDDRGKGPNTAGMGSVAGPDLLDHASLAEIERTVIRPVLAELANRGTRPAVCSTPA